MSTISASTTSTTAFKITTDTTGALVFQTGASPTTAMTLGSDQSVTFAGTPTYSGGTANGVAYLNGSKVLTTGTALVFDGSNLGVGVTPSAWGSGRPALEFGGATQPAISFNGNPTNGGAIWTNAYFNGSNNIYKANGYASRFETANGTFGWYTAASGTAGASFSFTQSMLLDASGNLGIGVTPSAWGGTSKAIQFSTGAFEARSASFSSNTNAYFNSGWLYVGTGRATLYNQTDGQHVWYNSASGTAGNAISFTQAMTLDASGRLGLNVTSLSARLEINQSGTADTDGIWLYSSGSPSSGGLALYKSAAGIGTMQALGSNSTLTFVTNLSGTNYERARISSAGVFTTPYQPIVAAYRSSNLTGYDQTAQTLVTVFNATEVNIGSCYSTSTGLFTAPATGTYLYYASAYTGGPSTLSQVWPVQNGNRGRSSRVGAANDVAVGTGTVYMTSGETLGVHFYGSDTSSTITSNSYHTFLYIYFLG